MNGGPLPEGCPAGSAMSSIAVPPEQSSSSPQRQPEESAGGPKQHRLQVTRCVTSPHKLNDAAVRAATQLSFSKPQRMWRSV